MNHSFTASETDSTRCRCGRIETDHTKQATCDSCGNTCGIDGKIHGQRNLLLCPECFDKEVEAYRNSSSEIDHTAQIINGLQTPASEILKVSRTIDSSVKVKEDLFNAKTKAIVELQDAINRDDSIADKHFTLCKAIEERFNHLTSILHDLKNKQEDALTDQRALQTFFQMRAQQLSIEQREQIKLKDLNYKPEPPKLVKSKPAPVRKFDINQLKLASAESKIPLQALQAVCVSRNVSALEAVRILKELGL